VNSDALRFSSSDSGRSIIFVHGRDFNPAADGLLDLTLAAVAAGLERECPAMLAQCHPVETRLAY